MMLCIYDNELDISTEITDEQLAALYKEEATRLGITGEQCRYCLVVSELVEDGVCPYCRPHVDLE